MVTSRYDPKLKDQIRPLAQLEILANGNDIEIYLEDQIEQMTRLKQHIKTNLELRGLTKRTIQDNA